MFSTTEVNFSTVASQVQKLLPHILRHACKCVSSRIVLHTVCDQSPGRLHTHKAKQAVFATPREKSQGNDAYEVCLYINNVIQKNPPNYCQGLSMFPVPDNKNVRNYSSLAVVVNFPTDLQARETEDRQATHGVKPLEIVSSCIFFEDSIFVSPSQIIIIIIFRQDLTVPGPLPGLCISAIHLKILDN